MTRSNSQRMPMGVGIDFGTTNSVVACHHKSSAKTDVCTDKGTGLPHPSVVWYRLNEQTRVGRAAKEHISSFAERSGNVFVHSVKRELGRGTTFDIFGKRQSPEEVAADIFRHLLLDARESHHLDVKEGIVTVPVYLDGRARRELRKAADRAGFFVKTFLHEPFAALIGYVFRDRGLAGLAEMAGKNVLVFDWGGGTLDITVGRVEGRQIIELATAGLLERSGDFFDKLVAGVGKRKFQDRHSLPPESVTLTPTANDRYNAECERCKIALSDKKDQALQLADFCRIDGRPLDLNEVLARVDFEAEIRLTVEEAARQVDLALEKAGLTARQIDLALLIGGSSLIPMAQDELRKRFGHVMSIVPNANSIIAEGAAIADAFGLRPAFAASVAMELADGTMYDVFKMGEQALPDTCKKQVNLFCTDNRDGQARIIVGLVDGPNKRFDVKRIITLPVSPDLPRPYHHERVQSGFHVDDDLVLHVNAKGATQSTGTHEEIVDLRYAVSFIGID